ncbi:Cse1-domain-containing protein [Zopfochytrium polystomum]|nr:Cse1-domain-containing protein [Zopfochytrium polystomum]
MEETAKLIHDTLSPVPAVRKTAEAALASQELAPLFSIRLLQLAQLEGLEPTIRFASVLYFKNLVKKNWKKDVGDSTRLPDEDRKQIKGMIVQLMTVSPQSIQVQLSEAISIIADTDFPQLWPDLIDDLVSKLNPNEYASSIGILQTAHSILKRWRHQFRSDELFTEINFVLSRFAEPFLQFFQVTDALIDANAGNVAVLELLFQGLLLLCKIFYSANSQDLPEFFENNQEAFMALFMKYLNYTNAGIMGKSLEDEPGPIEKVKSAICQILDLYGSKYEEDFKSLPQFVEAVWNLLTTTGMESKNDELVSHALAFLTAVVRPSRHKAMFESPDVLRNICEKIIIPNMTLRESDEELFNEDSIEFTRRDLEGTDNGTRRGASTDLIRGLLEHFAHEVTQIISQYLSAYMAEYEKDKRKNWKAKDTALYLLMAVSAKAYSLQAGVTETNSFIEPVPVFVANVLPDLQAPVDGAIQPIIKVAALKFLLIFRNQLTKEQLMGVLPLVVQHLSSSHYVVYTYASVCLERIIGMRRVQFTSQDIQPIGEGVLRRLFALIHQSGVTAEKISENDYLMKAIVRLLVVLKETAAPISSDMIAELTRLLEIIHKNPSNPKFNHYVFEALGTVIRSAHNNAHALGQFEAMLFPTFQAILQLDITEFLPYIFQLLSQLLVYHTEAGIPEAYQSILPPLLQPLVWESHGSIPGLVSLLDSYLLKGASQIVSNNQLAPILGVYQKLIGSRMNDQYGFDLLTSVMDNVPIANLAPYLKNVFFLILNRLKLSKTPKFTYAFVRFLCMSFVLSRPGLTADDIVGVIDSIQPLVFEALLRTIVAPTLDELQSPDDRRLLAVGIVTLLTTSSRLLANEYLGCWPVLLKSLSGMLQQPLAQQAVADLTDEMYLADVEEAGYQVTFSRLTTLDKKRKDPLESMPDARPFVLDALSRFKATPGMQLLTPEAASLFP